MQFSNFEHAADCLEDEIDYLTEKAFLTAKQAASIDRKALSAFFGGDLFRRIVSADRCLREYPFTFSVPASSLAEVESDDFAVAQGIADCILIEGDHAIVIDYKTDRIKTEKELAERYEAQLRLYQKALSVTLQMPVTECILYSFHLNCAIPLDQSPLDV